MMENKKTCIICNSQLEMHVKSNNYNYYRCLQCNTSQIFPQPENEILEKYYKSFHLSDESGGNYDWIEERMKADFSSKVRLIKKIINKSDFNLLDVGCGKGFFTMEAANQGINAVGIDVSESGINYAKNILNIKAEKISIEDFSKIENNKSKFDSITLWATIEHIADPYSLLSSINLCLKKDGCLFLDTGLAYSRIEKFLTGHSQWYDALQHLFVYSESGLRILLDKCGFEIIKVDRNYDRSFIRKSIRLIRHSYISLLSFALLRPVLGSAGFKSMQTESKWPIGKLINIVAKKR